MAEEAPGRNPIKVKGKFFEALKNGDAQAFLEFHEQHKTKRSPFTFEQLLVSMEDDELIESWKNILSLVHKHAKVALQVEDSTDTSEVKKSTDVIQTAALIGIVTFDQLSKVPVYMLQMILFLHDALLDFTKNQELAQDTICKLCERFWIYDMEGKEELVCNTITYLLKKTVDVKVKKADIKRVWLLKDCIKIVLDRANADKDLLQFYLNQCITSSAYLSCPEGSKFIEFLLCLDVSMLLTYHGQIKLRLRRRTQKECRVYGNIYFNAWVHATKTNSLELTEKLEKDCIQNFMYHAIHVQRQPPRSLFPLLRKLLSVFTEKKKDHKVAKMLRTLFEPIIWRALKDHNGGVRASAADIFFDFFPLEDPDMNIAETETEIQRQLLIVKDLLNDEYPVVRSIAAVGVCLVLAYHWELLSVDIVKTYFKILTDLSHDGSSADVRCALIKGLKVLVVQGTSVLPHLKSHLPKFGGMIHDVSEKVRIIFCQLLLAVKKVRFIKYWNIVPEENLLIQMEEDKPSVQKLIVELIFNSYLPEKESEAVWLMRCMELIKKQPVASKIFFRHLSQFTSLKNIGKLMVAVCQVLHAHISSKTKKGKSSRSIRSSNKENCMNNEQECSPSDQQSNLDNVDVIGGLVDGMAFLWLAIQNDLEKPENKILKKELIARYAMCMPLMLKFFKDTSIWKQVFFLCAFIPSSFIPVLSELCFSKLLELPKDSVIEEFKVVFVCLCYHEKTDELLQLIKQWIHHGLVPKDQSVFKSKAKRRKVSVVDGTVPKPLLAVKFLQFLMQDSLCLKAALKSETIKDIFMDELDSVQKAILDNKSSLIDEERKLFYSSSFSAIAKLLALLELKKEDSDNTLLKLLKWTNENFITTQPSATRSSKRQRLSNMSESPSTMWKELGFMIFNDLLDIASWIVVTMKTTETFQDYLQCIKFSLESDHGGIFILKSVCVCNGLAKNINAVIDEESKEARDKIHSLLLEAFNLICLKISEEKYFMEIKKEERDMLKTELKNFFSSLLKSDFMSNERKEKLVSSIFDIVVTSIIAAFEKVVSDFNFPPSASLLLSIFIGNELQNVVNSIPSWMKNKNLKETASIGCLWTEIILSNKSLLEKLDEKIRETSIEFIKAYENFKSNCLSEKEKSILKHSVSQIEDIVKLLQSE